MVTLPTRDGGTVTVTRCGALVDMHVQDSTGRTVATVVRPVCEAARLLPELRNLPVSLGGPQAAPLPAGRSGLNFQHPRAD